MNSTAYQSALLAHSAALRVYHKVRDGYRAGAVADAEFLAARGIKVIADEAFDAAFIAEQNR